MPPETKDACPLSPALLCLLQACLAARTTCDKELSVRLCRSPRTINTEFKLIARCLGTHNRFAAVLMAIEKGWINLSFASENEIKTT